MSLELQVNTLPCRQFIVKASCYRKAAEMCYIYLDPVTFTPSNLKQVIPGHTAADS